MNFPLEKIAIIGVGMIGGSFGLALKNNQVVREIVGCGRTEKNLQNAIAGGAIDRYVLDPVQAVDGADLIVFAAHNKSFAETLERIAPALKKGAVVTDVGSVKAPIVELGEKLTPQGCYFVGAHPIAGKEKSGSINLVEDLFRDRRCILTPTENTDPGALALVRKVWEQIGAIMIEFDPQHHDRVLAAISHLPHLVAYTLVNAVGELGKKDDEVMLFPAGGFGDITRIASSNPEMWRDIFLMNHHAMVEVIDVFLGKLQRLRGEIENDDGEALLKDFTAAKKTRETILVHGRPGG
jgi:prephenate dehydrogenase